MASTFEYVLSNGHKVAFEVVKATVIDPSEATHSVVSSGRRHVQSVDGRLISTPGAVQTELVTTSKVWVVMDDGAEDQVDISDFPVPLRPGHEIALAREVRNGKAGEYMGIYNKATQKYRSALDYTLEGQRRYGGGRPRGTGWKIVLGTPFACSLLAYLIASGTDRTGFAVIWFFLGIILGMVAFVACQFVMGTKWAKVMDEIHEKASEVMLAA